MTSRITKTLQEKVFRQYEIEQFYYDEAALLDERKFHEWLELLADDLEYWMPVRTTRSRDEMHLEFSRPGESAFFDDDKELMVARVKKLDTGTSWAEDPPSRTRHLVSNVRVTDEFEDGLVEVSCNMHVYRSRLANEEDWWFGRRVDQLRRLTNRWEITRRYIYLDHVRLDSKNLSIFF